MRISDWSSDVCSSDLFEDGDTVTVEDIQAIVDWQKERRSEREIQYRPARVLMQDFTGVPRSEEHTSELQSLMRISYAVFCLKKKKKHRKTHTLHIILIYYYQPKTVIITHHNRLISILA